MSEQVVTELNIDADVSGADTFARAMDGAAEHAARASASARDVTLALAGVGVASIALFAGVQQGLNYVENFNKQLADMASVAERTGLSLKDLQGIQFGGQIAGLSEGQITNGLERSAQLLNDAQRNANSLSKEFEANGISIRNVNGQLISENQLLQTAGDLVSRARNPQDAIAIAQMLGFTKEWVPLLQQGSGAMRDLGDQAKLAGAVIDDETINKASEFDAQWRKSSVEWSFRMRAAIAEILPDVDDMIQKAVDFARKVKEALLQGTAPSTANMDLPADDPAGRVLKMLARGVLESAGINPREQIGIEPSPAAVEAWETLKGKISDARDLLKEYISISGEIPVPAGVDKTLFTLGTKIDLSGADAMNGSAYPQSGPTSIDSILKAWDKEQDALQDRELAAARGFSNVAGRDQANDALDRAIASTQRHIAVMTADAVATDEGRTSLEALRAAAAQPSNDNQPQSERRTA